MKKNSSVYTYIILVAAVLLSKIFGLVRGMLLSHYYGTGIEASAFTAVSSLPLIIFDVTLGTAISSAFVPIFNEKLSGEGNKIANKFASNFLNLVLIISLLIVTLGMFFPESAVMLVASGFKNQPETMALASNLMRVIMPIMCFACCTFVFIGILQSYGEFIAPSLVSLFSNLAMILYLIFCNSKFGIYGLAVAFCFGWFLQFAFLVPFLKKKKFEYSFELNLRSPDLKRVAILTLPLFVAALAQPINQLISSNLSSSVSESGVATVNYAYNAYFIVAGVFSYALTNMFFPEMSRRFAQKDIDGATDICKDMLSTITAIIIPIMAFLCACSDNIIKILYQRGEFTAQDTANVSVLLSIYALGMIFLSWQDILNKYFYSMQISIIPMICAAIGIFVNFVFSFILTDLYGLKGLAVSTVIAGILMTVILCLFTLKFTKRIFNVGFILELIKILISGALAFVACVFIKSFFDFKATLVVDIMLAALLLFVVITIYFIALVITKSENVSNIIALFKKRR